MMKRLPYAAILACALLGCSADDGDAPLTSTGKFTSLDTLLANAQVRAAVARLPAGSGVAAGHFYEGETPNDISGTWSTSCCGGKTGLWPAGNRFDVTMEFDVPAPGHVDVPLADSDAEQADGIGSFVVGSGSQVTAFIQLSITCAKSGEHVRAVAIDRFVQSPELLTEYVRSYVVLARDHAKGPWTCFADAVGTGSVSTLATFGRQQ